MEGLMHKEKEQEVRAGAEESRGSATEIEQVRRKLKEWGKSRLTPFTTTMKTISKKDKRFLNT